VTEAYPSREDRVVAEFGAGYEVEGIAARYGLTVEQVYTLVEREVGAGEQTPPGHNPPPNHYAPPGYHAPPPPYPQPPAHYGPPPAPVHYQPAPPGYYPLPSYQLHGFADPDTIVAEYGDGHDVALIARRHGITVEQVYFIVHQALAD
jgi:Mor family transcriptional regulator